MTHKTPSHPTREQHVGGAAEPLDHHNEGDRPRRMSKMEALVRTTFTRAFKGDPKALASHETTTELLQGPEYAAIVADFLARQPAPAANDDVVDVAAPPLATSAKQEG